MNNNNTTNSNTNIYLANAFSLQMLKDDSVNIRIHTVSADEIPSDVISAVGHPDTAAVLTNMLGFNIPANRINLKLDKGDILYIAQLQGGRLPEGATKLPDNFNIKFYKVKIID